ncbi:MAG: cell division protein FtsA [Candidatus Brennerbacteria bacterium]|nr:cell division protein FtsA [Candidatus Brennerbacteria bacterium]
MARIVTGLDIGSAQIKCVVAEEKKDGTLSVLAAAKRPSSGLRRAMLVDVEDATRILREMVVDLQKISKRTVQDVFVNVNGEHIKPRLSRGVVVVSRADQEIQEDDIERALGGARAIRLTPNYLVLHNIAREFLVDDVGDIQSPLGMTGNRLEVSTLVIEAFSPQVNLLVKTLERVGMRIGGLIYSPIAAARAVLSKRQKDLGVLMIDFGFGSTSIAVFEENKILHAKSLPVGVGHVTNDIAVGLKTSVDAAEKIKLTYGFALSKEISRRDSVSLAEFDATSRGEISKRFISEIIEIRLAEILDLVNNELKSVGRYGELPGGVVITGGGVKTAGMAELVRKELKLPVQVGFPDLSRFEILNPAHQEVLDDPEFATSVGLTLWSQEENHKSERGNGFKKFLRNLIP